MLNIESEVDVEDIIFIILMKHCSLSPPVERELESEA